MAAHSARTAEGARGPWTNSISIQDLNHAWTDRDVDRPWVGGLRARARVEGVGGGDGDAMASD